MSLITSLKAKALAPVRRGQPIVFLGDTGMRFGNLLYLWLQADMCQRRGKKARVRDLAAGAAWRSEFPKIFAELVVPEEKIRFRDQRAIGSFQGIHEDYEPDDLEIFSQRYLLGQPGLTRFEGLARDLGVGGQETVTLNVRRGDYYSVPEYRERYGFDVRGYSLEALDRLRQELPFDQVVFVSDDIAWCLENLKPEIERMGCMVTYSEGRDAARDFAVLALSDRLILSNSTFSYWGGYAAVARNAAASVVAPWFHARGWLGGKSFHLHPSWTIVEGFDELGSED